MSKWFGKKQVLLSVLVVALGVAVYLNYYFASVNPLTPTQAQGENTQSTEKHLGDSMYVDAPTDEQEAVSYFDTARKNREDARKEAMDILQDMMQDVKITEEMQQEVIGKIEAFTASIEQESAIENLVLAKGFQDCVAYIEGDNCHIVVQADTLDEGQSVQILQIATEQSTIPAENVNIVAVNS